MTQNLTNSVFRIGQGYDIHAYVPNRQLILGGVLIPSTKGLLGHSDSDVLIHAIIDAMLGALSLGDIGAWFPDSDVKYKNINSLELLKIVYNSVVFEHKYNINNIDATIIIETPKLRPYIDTIRHNLAINLNIDKSQLSIKAKTNEQMDAVGKQDAVIANVVILLIKQE